MKTLPKKTLILNILDILRRYTDEDHRLSQKEIAALLHLSHENVRVLSLRARRELKQKLEEDGYDFS